MTDGSRITQSSFDPGVIWITGFSGSGKTTVARHVERLLRDEGAPVVWLDGDDLRNIFAARWGYDRSERIELGKVYLRLCNHLSSQGLVVVISAIAMYNEVRHWVRTNVPRYLEIYLNVPHEILLERDAKTKHLYSGKPHLTDMYDPPDADQLSLDNFGKATPESVAREVIHSYRTKSHIGADKGKTAYWEEYYRRSNNASPPSPFAIYIANTIPPGQRMLEVGCGNGRDATHFSGLGHFVTAIDKSDAAIQLCQSLHHNTSAEFFAGTLRNFSGKWENHFDFVYSRFVLHAMTQAEELEALGEAYRVLKPGGQILIECRSINDPLARQGEVISATERIAGHYRRFVIREELRDHLLACGFQITFEVEATGLAVFKDEDPVVIRLAAQKQA
jgi:bifunctional enzyme CysN/CysC